MALPAGDWTLLTSEDVEWLTRPFPEVRSMYRLNGEPEWFEQDASPVLVGELGRADAVMGGVVREPVPGVIQILGAVEVEVFHDAHPQISVVDSVRSLEGAFCEGDWPAGEPRPDSSSRLVIGAGGGDGAELYTFAHVPDEAGEDVEGRITTAPIAPAGAGGECIFTTLYLAVSSCTGGVVRITPIVDGQRYEGAARDVFLLSLGDEKLIDRFEVGLSRPLELGGQPFGQQALRGTWFQVELDARDLLGCGPFTIDGIELEWEEVTESHPGVVYAQEPTEEYERDFSSRLLVGSDEGRLLLYGLGADDDQETVIARVETAPLAPAGAGGECVFTDLYLTVTRSNRDPVRIELTPIVDGTPAPPIELTLPAVTSRVAETHEVGLSRPLELGGIPFGAQTLRGVWFALRIELLDPVNEGRLVIDGVELVHEAVTESEVPA